MIPQHEAHKALVQNHYKVWMQSPYQCPVIFGAKFKDVADKLYEITADGGVVIWVVNDQVRNGSETGSSFKQALYFMEIGFRLHDTMIFQKAKNFLINYFNLI